MLLHSVMYELADKYEVVGLKRLTQDKLRLACRVFWNKYAEFAEAAEHVFESTPDSDEGLRNCIRDTITEHRELIVEDHVKEFLRKQRELMYELLAQGLEPPSDSTMRDDEMLQDEDDIFP
ncbi:hypothetical protein EK21DRAFT_118878 [Setomelanomma holmii]|uniref:Uncharacterized protein n=1 Tax=Setomelanomma holmii TaxID=210430 RepID=A0A9P4GXK7_9PLEO|nr:hypothetical protein EK21DRAFT_118878 [Setomelanomma holmii]